MTRKGTSTSPTSRTTSSAKSTPWGTLPPLPAMAPRGFSGDGGPATGAELNQPFSVTADAAGNIYIQDTGNNRIRKVDTTGTITTFAGNGTAGYQR